MKIKLIKIKGIDKSYRKEVKQVLLKGKSMAVFKD